MNKDLFIYAIFPIDYWAGWQPLKTLPHDDRIEALERLMRGAVAASKMTRGCNWEGDLVHGSPYWAPIPARSEGEYILAWKQGNNGTTFVVSPYSLPWLDKECIARSVDTWT